jgi:hypothetical protein
VSDSRLLEIVARAVVGRAERRVTWSHTVAADGVTGVLGVHITDSAVAIKEKDGKAVVDVLVDCDLWCGSKKQTKVLRSTSRHTETVNIRSTGTLIGECEMNAKLAGLARATGVEIGEDGVTIQMELDVSVEMAGMTRMLVRAYDLGVDLEDVDDLEGESGSDSGSDE